MVQPSNPPLQPWTQCSGTVTRGPVTLPAPGTYTIVIDPGMYNTGTATVREWLRTQSLEEQLRFGRELLEQYGIPQ